METTFFDSTLFRYVLAIIFLACLLLVILFIRNSRIDKKLKEIDDRYNKGVDAYFDDDEKSQGSPIISEEQKAFYEKQPKTVSESFPIKPTARFSQKIYLYEVLGNDNYLLLNTFKSMRVAEMDSEVSRYTIKQSCEKSTKSNTKGEVIFSYTKIN